MKSKNNGITLISLVITIVILLILAGVTIRQLAGNGLFDKVKLAKEKSDEAQAKENAILDDYESKIGEYINGTRNLTSNLDGGEMKLLTKVANTTKEIGTYDMSVYTREEEDICNNYLQYSADNKYYKIKKSGWYIIDISTSCAQNNNYSYVTTNIFLNGKNINTCQTCGMTNSVDFNSNSLTLYLSKDNTFSVNKNITVSANDTWNNSLINIWVLE